MTPPPSQHSGAFACLEVYMYIGLTTEEQERAGMAIHQRKGFWHQLDNIWSIREHGYCIACTNDFVRGWNAVMYEEK